MEHLGDIVACEPVLRHVRGQYPHAHISWIVRRPYRELLDSHPCVDEVIPVDCLGQAVWLRDLVEWDEYIDLHVHGRTCRLCREPLKKSQGDSSIDVESYYQHGTLLGGFCRGAGLPELDEGPRIHIPSGAVERVESLDLPPRYVAIHCSSNESIRDWRLDKWSQFCRGVASEFNLAVVEVGLKGTLQSWSPGWRCVCGRLSILETAEVIRRARLFVGVDSGPAHLANATETPSVILLGHYKAFTSYMPYNGFLKNAPINAVFHHDGPVAAIPVESVLGEARRILHLTAS